MPSPTATGRRPGSPAFWITARSAGARGSTALLHRPQSVYPAASEKMPRVFGRSLLHVSEVDAIVENNVPLLELPTQAAGPEDHTIARTVAEMVPDEACLQMGVGSLPNLVCTKLGGQKDLGIHTECFALGRWIYLKRAS